ncbi:hypothetical protein TNCV_4001881 [Trichonephila clavipes]|uniref:Transposase n=1 Tax=Trichonephila clavipes TaxID=2585209 RepID=A0A8X6RTC3_TRICX|nr:hypothetical protein TNCV_4001881 [Trichonephila clavipes]
MITNFFIPELNNHDVQELWFQQDGATCHTARATIDLLKDTFGDRLISRFGPVNWPSRSCDRSPVGHNARCEASIDVVCGWEQEGSSLEEGGGRERISGSMINEASFRKRHRRASGGPTLSPADGEPARFPFTIRQIGRQLRPFKSQREQGWECSIETVLMTAHINTDFVNHPVPSTTEPSTSLVRVGTDACESIIKAMTSIKMRGHGSLVVRGAL